MCLSVSCAGPDHQGLVLQLYPIVPCSEHQLLVGFATDICGTSLNDLLSFTCAIVNTKQTVALILAGRYLIGLSRLIRQFATKLQHTEAPVMGLLDYIYLGC